jgi:leucyl-tRNA synthetase
MEYNYKEIENKWQEKEKFIFNESKDKPKKFIVPMFPYPSGNIHIGHMRNYVISDVFARYWRNKGYNTFHPIGWDSFGMPAEIAAIKNKIHPKEWTDKNIDNMRNQIKSMGISFNWDREISTCETEYWKWEQKFFSDMWKNGMIERKKGIVNWDPATNSVIANEQVQDGKSIVSGAKVQEKEMNQYYIKTTIFSEDIIKDIDNHRDRWPNGMIRQQKNFVTNGVRFGDKVIPYSDWCISRQRYWGTPIPTIKCGNCGIIVNENYPIEPPKDVNFTGEGNPIENHENWKYCKCPKCNEDAIRETDTMDTFVQSSWYFIRYVSEFNGKKFDYDSINYWFPIDYYIGGAEHSTSHMIYSRIFWKIFKKFGYIPDNAPDEPYDRIINQGMVKRDGKKMSKSYGNGVSPNEMIEKYGADSTRMFIIFSAPIEQNINWNEGGINGSVRFVRKFYNSFFRIKDMEHIVDKEKEEIAIRKIEEMKEKSIRAYEKTFKINTIVSSVMETWNAISKQTNKDIWINGYKEIIDVISPIIPHVANEIREMIE